MISDGSLIGERPVEKFNLSSYCCSFSHITRELPFDVPFSAKVDAIRTSFERWNEITDRCLNAVIGLCRRYVMKLVDKIFDEDNDVVRWAMRQILFRLGSK